MRSILRAAALTVLMLTVWLCSAQTVSVSPQDVASPAMSTDDSVTGPSSVYIELDSWVYPAIERLAAQGIVQMEFLGLRPWTRAAVYQLLDNAVEDDEQTADLVNSLRKQIFSQSDLRTDSSKKILSVDQLYTRTQYISGIPLNDSYHFGQTNTNDFGRPFGQGLQQISGFETRAEHGRLSVFLRGEYQRTPSVPGYDSQIAQIIATQDGNPVQIYKDVAAKEAFHLLDTYASVEVLGHQLSLGKQSYWWGPGSSSAMMLSDNAEPFYSLRINRTQPLLIPLISRLLGPFRYDNFFGRLSGHQYPRQPYFYGQKISFSPTKDLELGFSRDAVIAGEGSTALTFGNFWKSFTSTSSGTYKSNGKNVLGARHGGFDFRYRLPGVRNWVTVYADSLIHDDISPVDAPRRAATTSGIYLSTLPFVSKMDMHVEGGSSDIPASAEGGKFYYYETVYRDCYTNKHNLLGSWLGREGTGGQAWSTYWLNPQSTLQLGYRTLKVSHFFVPQGVSQQAGFGELRYHWRSGLALQFRLQAERWAAPALTPKPQTDITTRFEVSFSPKDWGLQLRH